MRDSQFLPRFGVNDQWRPSHIALAYDAWAPVDETGQHAGKVPPERGNKAFKSEWLDELERLSIDPDYQHAYARWKQSLAEAGCRGREIELASRLLVGHGNASATEVGLTVHHTWGVPIIPGSALKGLCAHYTAATYGTKDDTRTDFAGPEREDKRNGRAIGPPGDYYRALFGAPDMDDTPASAGLVVFHDALYVPDSPTGLAPFAVDVLTVHQKSYYGQGKEQAGTPGERWPNDYDSPNPVGFISVKPGARLLLAVDGDPGWTALALELLTEALRTWGAGGKTSAGYGRSG